MPCTTPTCGSFMASEALRHQLRLKRTSCSKQANTGVETRLSAFCLLVLQPPAPVNVDFPAELPCDFGGLVGAVVVADDFSVDPLGRYDFVDLP